MSGNQGRLREDKMHIYVSWILCRSSGPGMESNTARYAVAYLIALAVKITWAFEVSAAKSLTPLILSATLGPALRSNYSIVVTPSKSVDSSSHVMSFRKSGINRRDVQLAWSVSHRTVPSVEELRGRTGLDCSPGYPITLVLTRRGVTDDRRIC